MTVCGECHNNHRGSARPCLCFDGHGVDRLGVEMDMIMMEEAPVSSMTVMQGTLLKYSVKLKHVHSPLTSSGATGLTHLYR